ncbi:hypothetical protein BSKO_04464 [Bryopsis sp. KO-2023]|nr:hypothetical protein BSKO_04464 [Bryopsis sp. KO-2023]
MAENGAQDKTPLPIDSRINAQIEGTTQSSEDSEESGFATLCQVEVMLDQRTDESPSRLVLKSASSESSIPESRCATEASFNLSWPPRTPTEQLHRYASTPQSQGLLGESSAHSNENSTIIPGVCGPGPLAVGQGRRRSSSDVENRTPTYENESLTVGDNYTVLHCHSNQEYTTHSLSSADKHKSSATCDVSDDDPLPQPTQCTTPPPEIWPLSPDSSNLPTILEASVEENCDHQAQPESESTFLAQKTSTLPSRKDSAHCIPLQAGGIASNAEHPVPDGSMKSGPVSSSVAIPSKSGHSRNPSCEPLLDGRRSELHRHLSAPLPMSRQMEERIQTLGPALPVTHKWLLWVGIFLDIACKISLVRELARFANRSSWEWFSLVLIFFLLSSAVVTAYWRSHYSEAMVGKLSKDDNVRVYGFSKNDVKRFIRSFGTVCAVFQLGTAFAATRALFSSETRQRVVAMDLRGMRLVDTVFLTLVLSILQVYIGMHCSKPETYCQGREGFDMVLCLSVIGSLVGSTLSYLALDLNDIRALKDVKHTLEATAFFMARLLELSARVILLALLGAVCRGWILVVIALHAVFILLALRFSVHPRRNIVWQKVAQTSEAVSHLGGKKRIFHLPVLDDMKLLVACLAWPPACFVSDATDRNGQFWWRCFMLERRPFWGLTLNNALIPWPIFMFILAMESGMSFALIYSKLEPWAEGYFKTAISVHMLWYLFAAIWVSVVHICNALSFDDDVGRNMAIRQLEDSRIAQNMSGVPTEQQDKWRASVESQSTQYNTLPSNFNLADAAADPTLGEKCSNSGESHSRIVSKVSLAAGLSNDT